MTLHQMKSIKCIYCLRNLNIDAFNTEHVISQAFGTFEQNLTLNDMVCADCNSYFGDNLELFFARDSAEAYERIKHGIKPPEKIRDYPQNRLTFSLDVDDKKWRGALVRLTCESDTEVVELVPQVGFRRETYPDWISFTEDEIANPETPIPSDIADDGMRIIAPTDDVMKRLIGVLRQRGIPFEKKGQMSPPSTTTGDIGIFVHTKIDPIVKRCMAKIAFNYLGYTAG